LRPSVTRVVKELGRIKSPPNQTEIALAVEAMIERAHAAGDDRGLA
jgi:hypothetical protein